MDSNEMVGFAAAVLTTVSFYPQAFKIIKTKDTQSISLAMYSIINLGIALWLVYGILKGDKPIIYANAFTLVASLTILLLKLKNTIKRK
jgi:Uncharacterized conserved protein